MRDRHYRQRVVTDVREGFRPVGGMLGDFTIVAHEGRYHIFAIERRLAEGTPFYPGHEAFFCHASTVDFVQWEVHDPVMWARPGTWEGAHVWAPFVSPWRGGFVMAYTGVNRHGSQDIGLAFSADLFEWTRWQGNPLSLLSGCAWAFWRSDGIASCRDPHLLIHNGRVYMTYTANTREGASCIALASTSDLVAWQDHGPILIGAADGYESRLDGGHPKGQLESSNLLHRCGRWLLLVQEKRRDSEIRNWIYESEWMDRFDYAAGREFWPDAYTVEVVAERSSLALLACTGHIRLGVVDWAQARPTPRFITDAIELASWRL
jgi:hypothetical protein